MKANLIWPIVAMRQYESMVETYSINIKTSPNPCKGTKKVKRMAKKLKNKKR